MFSNYTALEMTRKRSLYVKITHTQKVYVGFQVTSGLREENNLY